MSDADFMRELQRIQRYAAGMGSLLARAQEHAPPEATGADRTGAVRVALGPDGLPEHVRVEAGWQQRLDPTGFGAAVGEAFTNATANRIEAWTAALRDEGWMSDLERLRTGADTPDADVPAASPHPATAGRPRPLDVVTEDVLAAFEALDAHTSRPPAPPEGSGVAADGRLTVSLSRAGGVSCTADPQWLSQADRTTLIAALDEALAAARADLAAAAEREPEPAAGLDRLFTEALDLLKPEHLAGPGPARS